VPNFFKLLSSATKSFFKQPNESFIRWCGRRAAIDRKFGTSVFFTGHMLASQPVLANHYPPTVIQAGIKAKVGIYLGLRDTALGLRYMVIPRDTQTRLRALTHDLPIGITELGNGVITDMKFIASAAPHIPKSAIRNVQSLFTPIDPERWSQQKELIQTLAEKSPEVIPAIQRFKQDWRRRKH
jgi:hypothetical protein